MGQAPSALVQGAIDNFSNHHNKEKFKDLTVDIDIQITEIKLELNKVRLKGIKKQEKREEEIYALRRELYDKRSKLMEMAKHCQDVFTFGDYVNIIQTTYSSEEIATTPVKTVIPDDGERPKTREMVPQHFKLSYTIFAWFEAYLLKRLHLAMLQQRQKNIHAKTWSGVVSDLYFEIPQMKKNFETKLGGLFVRKQNVEIEKHQKQDAYADHVRIQAKIIMEMEKASWDPARRKSLPQTINIQEDVKKCGTDATAEMSRSGSRLSVSTRDGSEGVAALTQEMEKINESGQSGVKKGSSSASISSRAYESDITDSGDEEDSHYSESDGASSGEQPSHIAVKALQNLPDHRVSALTVPKDTNWHAENTAEEREQARKQAAAENARLERERLLRKTQELKARNSAGSIQLVENIQKVASGESNISDEELERLKRLEEARREKERQRNERAAFKAQRLRDLQTRLQRASGHSRASDMSGGAASSTSDNKPLDVMQRLQERSDRASAVNADAAADAAAVAIKETTEKKESSNASKSSKSKKDKKEKKRKSERGSDDKSIKSSEGSVESRKSRKRNSLLAAEKRAQEKMAALSQMLASEELESYVQEKEGKQASEREEDELVLVPKSPAASTSSRASRESRRSQRLSSIRKAEAKAALKLAELEQFAADDD